MPRTRLDIRAGLGTSGGEQLDVYGRDARLSEAVAPLLDFLYSRWFRVEVEGAGHVPAGGALLVANHAGALPLDGPMLHEALRRERPDLPDSRWLDFFWPIFGLGVIVGALLSTRLRATGDLRALLSGAYLIQAGSIALGIWSPSLVGFALGSFLLGVPFTAITFFAMQEVRRLRPLNTASTIGLLTATYGIGQIIGPPMVAALLRQARSVNQGFTLGLAIAAAGLLLGAAIYEGIRRAYPVCTSVGRRA